MGFKDWWAGIKLEMQERFSDLPHTTRYVPLFRETSPDGRLDAVLTREPYFGNNLNPQTSHTAYLFLAKPGNEPDTSFEVEFARWEDTSAIKIVWRSDKEFEVHGDYDVCEVKSSRVQLLGREGYTTVFGCR